MEAGVGSIRTHPSISQRIGPKRRRQGRRPGSKTLDDSKLTPNWGRSLQIINEEVGLADSAPCECGEPEQTADHIINSCPLHRPLSEAGPFEVGPLTRAWLQQTELTILCDDIGKKTLKYRHFDISFKDLCNLS